MTKILFFLTLVLLAPITAVVLVLISPFWLSYKIFDRVCTYRELKNGYHVKEEKLPSVVSFAMPFLKDFMNPKKA